VRSKFQSAFIAWRFYFVVSFILILVTGLVVRMVDLTVFKQSFLLGQGNSRAVRIVNTPSFRGMITDRNGYPLAISTSVFSVWANPEDFVKDEAQLKKLSQLLGMKSKDLTQLVQLYVAKKREFVYLKRGVSPEIAQKIRALKLPGVFLQQDYKRYYPEGEVASQVIGFTNVDDHGQEGLELGYNQWLSGMPGKRLVVKDRLGREISEIKSIQEQKAGNDLTLSINRRIQYLAYRELLQGVKDNLAQSGSVVVLDTRTGEVLAMVNQPSFNPNNRVGEKTENFRNRAVTDTFEPGSTIKAFSIASALDSKKYTPDTIIDTYPGWLRVGKNLVRDEHSKGPMTVTQILQISSNVGVTKIILSLPPDQLWSLLHRVGFGEATGIEYPGEQSGKLLKQDPWKPFALATLSFGYGISVTPLQLAQAYAVIANQGIKRPVTLLRLEKAPAGKRVMEADVAAQMMQLLEAVVEKKGGTGFIARIPGYRIAGKTGTARMLGPSGYLKDHHESSFVGIIPATQPRLIVAVVIHDPQGKKYFGGDVAAPVFKNIAEGALRILNIPPDDPDTLQKKAI
jgi:cell division protein FtsI (penicillin-binding protein 3)